MSARGRTCHSRPGGRALAIRGRAVSRPPAEAERPAAAPRRGDHLAPGARPGRRSTSRLSIAQILIALGDLRRARGRDRVLPAARADVAGERAADRERRRVHPARARHAARRLVEHERLVDLRRHRRGVAALEVRDQVGAARTSSTRRTSGSSSASCSSAASRAEPLDFWWGPMSRVARRSRSRSSSPAASRSSSRLHAAADRGRASGSRSRPALGVLAADRPRDDRALAPRAGHRPPLLVGARHLAGGARLPLLHDHRPEDDADVARAAGSSTPSSSACSRRC